MREWRNAGLLAMQADADRMWMLETNQRIARGGGWGDLQSLALQGVLRYATQAHAQEIASTNTSQDIDGHVPAATSSEGPTSYGPDTSAQGIKAQAHISAIAAAHEANANAATTNTEVLRDIDGDGYFESTQWVSATDSAGNAQGMLVLDANRNGSIETADILHLGGNSAERNSMAWLDSNGDGKLDASDPAFAAIRLWVDVNHNGRMDDGESTGLQGIQLTSIDLKQGTLNYADGQSDTLSTTTLKADTEGVKLDTVKVVGADGTVTLNASGNVVFMPVGDDWLGGHRQSEGRTGKSLRVKARGSPRRIYACSYAIRSNSRNHRRGVRQSLQGVGIALSPIHGMYAERIAG